MKILDIYFKWEGRICRKTYWIFQIPITVIMVLLESFKTRYTKIDLLLMVVGVYCAVAINIKRAHDRNRSGWFVFLLVVPIVCIWPDIELGFLKGTDTDNRFGSPDKTWTK